MTCEQSSTNGSKKIVRFSLFVESKCEMGPEGHVSYVSFQDSAIYYAVKMIFSLNAMSVLVKTWWSTIHTYIMVTLESFNKTLDQSSTCSRLNNQLFNEKESLLLSLTVLCLVP